MTYEEFWMIGPATAIAVVLCVALHFEGLTALRRTPIFGTRHRVRIISLILCILTLHILEIWIFGLVYYWLVEMQGLGSLAGMTDGSLFEYIYFSATVFTTVGFGDIFPIGAIRFLTGTEAVTGLTMITWSASFTFLELSSEHAKK